MVASRTGTTKYLKNRATLMRNAQRQGITQCPGYNGQPCGRTLNYAIPRLDESAEADHIISPNHGGTDNLNNLQVLCRKCNNQKSDGRHTPKQTFPPESYPTSRQW